MNNCIINDSSALIELNETVNYLCQDMQQHDFLSQLSCHPHGID